MLRSSVLLAALLLVSVAQAAVDPHPRATPSQTMPGPITAIAVGGNGAVAAGMNDTGRSVGQPSDAKVVRWWEPDGDLIRETRADENNCSAAGAPISLFDNCIGDVVDLAVSGDGQRLAVAARGNDASSGRVLFLHATAGQVAILELDDGESPTSLAMSPDGTRVALGMVRPGANTSPDTGKVRLYAWSGSGAGAVSESWEANTPSIANTDAGVTKVAIGPDNRIDATVGDRNVRFSANGAVQYVHDTDADLLSVAYASQHGSHWSVVGAQDGGVLLYSDAQDTSSVAAAADIQRGGSPVRAVAFTPNAQLFASGDGAGIVRLFRNLDLISGDRDVGATPALDGGVSAMQVSNDGNYLAVAAGRGTYLYRISATALSEVWRSVGTAAVTDVGLSSDGSFVASSSGSTVTVYTAVHAVTLGSPASTTLEPGAAKLVTLTLKNTGNREAFVPLSVIQKPADWTADLSVTGLTIAPDATATVTLNVTPPPFAAPGAAAIKVRHSVQGIPQDSDVNVQVAQVKRWTVQADGAVNRGLDAGGSVTFPLRLQNLGNGADTTTLSATVDRAGWTATVEPASLNLAQGATGFANVTLTSSGAASNGETGKVTVTLSADNTASIQVSGTIGARFAPGLVSVPTRSDGLRGQDTTFLLRVSNAGNAPDSFSVQTGGVPAGWEVVVDDAPLAQPLAPGASVDLTVTITPDAGANPATYQLTFTAKSLGDPGKSTGASHDVVIAGSDGGSSSGKGRGSPGLAPALVGVVLIAIVFVRRRN